MLACLLVRQELIKWCFEKYVFSKRNWWKNAVKRTVHLTRSVPCSHIPATFLAKRLCGGCQLFASFLLSSAPLLFTLLSLHKILPASWKKRWAILYITSYSLVFSSPFLFVVLGLKLEINAFSSLQTHPSIQALSFFLNFPVPFSTLFATSLSLITGFFLCQHKCAVITPYAT